MRQVPAGSTDVSVTIRIVDASDGTPETGVEHNTSGIDLWYRRQGATKVSITEAALSALTDAHSDGGIEHIGDGYYRLDLPDAAVAAGADTVTIGGTVTGMIVIGTEIQLVDDLTVRGVVSDEVVEPTTTTFAGTSDLASEADFYAGGILVFTTGSLKGVARPIESYAGDAGDYAFTFAADNAFPAAPADGDRFSIIGHSG